jgi:hypothetical protein
MKVCRGNCFNSKRGWLCASVMVSVMCLFHLQGYSQDATGALNAANTSVRQYFAIGINIMYAVGGIVGIIGAVKVYQKWSNGHPDTGSVAAAWFGSCIFLVMVATALKSFFGLA